MSARTELRAGEYWERLDHFLAAALHDLSRTRIERLIRAGQVTVNGEAETRKSLFGQLLSRRPCIGEGFVWV